MAGRGRPRKNLVTGEAEPVKRQKEFESIPTSNIDDSVRFDFSEREALNKEFMKKEYGYSEEEPETVPPTETEEKVEPTESAPEIAEKTEEVAKEEKPSDETKIIVGATDPEKDTRTVPYGALHEEREKRKALQRKLDEFENESFRKKETLPESDGEDELVYKSEVRRLEKEITELKGKFVQDERTKAEIEREKNITKTDEYLQSEGIVGFSEIGRHVVLRKLTEMYADDPNYALAHDNPEGWAKIYKEEYPKIQKVFVDKARTKTFEDKKALKSQAGLITTPGSNPKQEKEDEKKDLSYEETLKEYSKMRTKVSL